MENDMLNRFKSEIEKELRDNILEFWINYSQDNEYGGFYGYISHDLKIKADYAKASVLNFRILWTFSAAYRLYSQEKYLHIARRAYEYIKKHFIDNKNYGVYWMLDHKGQPIDAKNQVYSVAFAIYGLSEYYRAFGETEALDLALKLYESLEKHARDRVYGGYIEALEQDWSALTDMSLSDKDMNVPKSMNTHLHVMEAYTNLLRVHDSPQLRESLRSLLIVLLEHIINHETWSFDLFFTMDWTSCADVYSYGHNIEGSWLIYESADVLGDPELLEKAKTAAVRMAQEVRANGLDHANGGIYYEMESSGIDDRKDWWPQAEAVVGFFNAWQITGDEAYLDEALKTWKFIQKYLVDRENGEWYWGVTRDGSELTSEEKAGSWKCPYHNSRMCFEIVSRVSSQAFEKRLNLLMQEYNTVTQLSNTPKSVGNGIFERFENPVLTRDHIPVFWKYDLDERTNPWLMERIGVNCVFNAGAVELDGRIYLVARVEGNDRKSFFAIAESDNGIDHFKFWDYPIVMPQTENPDVNVYDMRITKHEDGWMYGLFCTERKDPDAPFGDTSSAVAACGIARTRDLKTWERLPDLKTKSPQQRNVVLHPEFVDRKYALYTRPQDGFIETGKGGGIGWGLTDSMENARIDEETLMECKEYHTIKEVKNGQGPAPIKTKKGWLHIAHGVRNTAAGLRYVVYAFLSDLRNPHVVTHRPGGFLIAPEGEERIGDVSNVIFCNGAVARDNGELLIYYASSDTRMHVARTSIDKMLDYVLNTPEDPLISYECVQIRSSLIDKNLELIKNGKVKL